MFEGLIYFALLLGLMFSGIPVALSLILTAFIGISLTVGVDPAVRIIATVPYDFASSWTMSSIPMFLLMGYIAYYCRLTDGVFNVAKLFFARVPGGLAISGVFACTGFATVCGSSLATSAAMTKIAVPEMIKAGYKPSFSCGTIAASGTIGALIPPSIIMILFGVLSNVSVPQVFAGGLIAGLLTSFFYCLGIVILCTLRPNYGPRAVEVPKLTWDLVGDILPLVVLVAVIFGGIFSGLFTATETGAAGCLAAIVIAAFRRNLTFGAIKSALFDTLTTTGSIIIISVGASAFTKLIGLTGIASSISAFVADSEFTTLQLIAIISLIYIILGMFIEPFGTMLITLPIVIPILNLHEISLIWFGVFLTKLLEFGMLTPPFGLNVFVVADVGRQWVRLGDVYRGVAMFIALDLVILVTLYFALDYIVAFTRLVG